MAAGGSRPSSAPPPLFVDSDFAGGAAIGSVKVQAWRYPVKWRRAAELHATPNLFSFIEADNISQGELGDCWLLAAFAVLADFPGHIQNLFDETALSPAGRYTVRLHDVRNGWEDVVIDDLIPCDKNGKPLFAQMEGQSGAVWALLLEKACAKFCGSYGGLEGGGASWAWQALTGQVQQAHWKRGQDCQWKCFHLAGLREAQGSEAGRQKWRREGMKQVQLLSTGAALRDDAMFTALAAYSQANFPIACAIERGGMEEERRDGLLSRHEYSLVEVVCARGVQLVKLRNPWGKGGEWQGAWGDGASEWTRHPKVAADLPHSAQDDGTFWMPFAEFANIFGGSVSVCPATLPCPRNSQQAKETGRRSAAARRCPQCHQPHTRSWVLLTSGEWHNLMDGTGACFLCLRATCRARAPPLSLEGVHRQPELCTAPPKAPRRLDLCAFGAGCYRRNPQHFRECFHPSLLPPAPLCTAGCGRSAASGFPTCCRCCTAAPPDLEFAVPAHLGIHPNYSGLYQALPERRANGAPVYRQRSSRQGCWLWKGDVWMLSAQESAVGGRSGSLSGTSAAAPHLVGRDQWSFADKGGWTPCKITVTVIPGGQQHDGACDERFRREEELTALADALHGKWSKAPV